MWITITFAVLGLIVGLRITSRMGAVFLMFAFVTIVHVVFTTGPDMLTQSAYGRRLAATFRALVDNGDAGLMNLMGASALGLVGAWNGGVERSDLVAVAMLFEKAEGGGERGADLGFAELRVPGGGPDDVVDHG